MGALQVIDLDRDDIKNGLQDGSILLVDVREPHEYEAGHIPGAISHPLSTFDPSSLPEGKRIVFSCAAGVRSVRAMEFAQAAGHDIREHYKGGFRDWVSAGEPVEQERG
ncbi:sulfurtransferase [Microvirga sp. ACRRW]|uniref:rhodanese-like domain-containing protein n=1 Tax=Microvirga sp. ACRRW TaxID=2918205 RepID=UPI001EF4E7C8|nr:rhodanese-like domain-containing protein [Microvirga sp. ACRRW]MCG7391472.1 sulfurtransferase [Microvirga sp. ACRRW]